MPQNRITSPVAAQTIKNLESGVDLRAVNRAIGAYHERLNELKSQALALAPVVGKCRNALTKAESSAVLSLETHNRTPVISITAAVENLNELKPVIAELAKVGIRRKNPSAYEDSKVMDMLASRHIEFEHDVHLTAIVVGEQCTMKQVGVKEVPIYEMNCTTPRKGEE